MFRSIAKCIAVFFFLIVIKNSDQKCSYKFPNHEGVTCNSIKDLYTLKEYLALDITIMDQSEHNQELEPVPLVNFTNLRHLHFDNNKLSEIPAGTFKDLNITVLSFDGNNIKTVAPFAFINLANLQQFILKRSNLTKISLSVFNNLPVHSLVLSDNNISEIEKFSFGNMPNLLQLSLGNNQLTEFIPQEQLHYPERLELLELGINKLREVTVYMLEGLINLKNLYLEHNLISVIESKAFEKTPKLALLALKRNLLREVTVNMLEGLNNLKYLNLEHNLISVIEPKAFEKTPKLELLALSNNSLKVISSNIFPEGGLNNLNSLYLDQNRLMYVPSTFFTGLTALRFASIVGNPWKCPCLDLIYRWLHDKGVKLKGDREHQLGKWPVCVVPDRNICTYTYEEKLFGDFQNKSRRYNPPSHSCISITCFESLYIEP